MCTSSEPIATHATASCVRRKLNSHGYQPMMLSVPLASMKNVDAHQHRDRDPLERLDDQRTARPSAGRMNSRGKTDHSLTSSSGIAAVPEMMCSPCVQR